ncbi:Fasciclin domain-containing protein [Cephalotus follicularis]|uniref:Fasciclin domain-containing protein n=1 Tax=Cephalotus follicularis TaxID=3775 RepID=A0A1Q3C908_CEPFO|nr:Fasciclin domain-containing protein [Cephalotus follicularis]
MGTYMTLIVLLMALISTATPSDIHAKNQDLLVAIEEMKRANYFTFVLLINMSPLEQAALIGNVTFLMPNDRMLSKITMRQNAVSDFLLLHSIPSPLLLEHLEHIPTGSFLPSSLPEFMLNISNNGRRRYFLNNVKIISPNICTAGSSIRCHGIDGVLKATKWPVTSSPMPSCSNITSPTTPGAMPLPPFLSPPTSPANPVLSDPSQSPAPAPAPAPSPSDKDAGPKKSGSSQWLPYGGLLKFLFVMVSVLGVSV